ncbi:MAG: hypothetical protein PW791_10240 [Neorhizobium sp.]|nr:hypothetical protein [Neorhizobium sp.]
MRNVGLAAIAIAAVALMSGQALAQPAPQPEKQQVHRPAQHHTVCKLEAKKVKVHGKWTVRKEKVCH